MGLSLDRAPCLVTLPLAAAAWPSALWAASGSWPCGAFAGQGPSPCGASAGRGAWPAGPWADGSFTWPIGAVMELLVDHLFLVIVTFTGPMFAAAFAAAAGGDGRTGGRTKIFGGSW